MHGIKSAGRRSEKEVVLHGIGVSPGVAVGTVFLLGVETDHCVERTLSEEELLLETARLEEAFIETRGQIKEIQRSVEAQMAHVDVSILDAHLMVLDDRVFVDEVISQIVEKRRNAEPVLWEVARKYMAVLAAVEDDYLRERVADVKDVTRRIVRNLTGEKATVIGQLREPSVIVANDLAPSETAGLRKDLVLGVVTDAGSPTSHSAMLARAMEIPAVVGMHDLTGKVSTGDRLLMDGNKGVVILNPSRERLEAYGKVIKERKHIQSGLTSLRHQAAETKDGVRIVLSANIEMPSDVDAVLENGAEGVGLFRSEYFYLVRGELPSEDEMTAAYESVAAKLAPAPVIVRTLDMGGDKVISYLNLPVQPNAFLGYRSIRFSLAEPEIFKTQLRAILRASVHGNVKVMYPMISNTEEVIRANELLGEAKADLRLAGRKFDENIEVGAMIETPSAALTADLIAAHVKFLSIGTNDLIQYAIAVDRVNELVAHLYQPTHPAILRLIRNVIELGHRRGVWVGVCGEMAADPVLSPLLVGLGVDKLSVSPPAVPIVKAAIRSVTISEARNLAEVAGAAESAEDVLAQCRKLVRRIAPEILELTS